MNKTKVLVADGLRYQRSTGYGALSRAIILSLKRQPNIDLYLQGRKAWDQGVPWVEELANIEQCSDHDDVDIVLAVGTPPGFVRRGSKPNILYTQNALGGIPSEWIEILSKADAIIVPGNFDKRVFDRHFESVYICPQYVDGDIFKPKKRFRKEGVNRLSYIFVGSYSYRKGVDILFPAFAKAFNDDRPVNLHFQCATGLEKNNLTHFARRLRRFKKNIKVSAFAGQISPEWMSRIYNQHDVVVSLSRGEGWCMPLHEGLLSGLPVIAPRSTAMDEALPERGVRRVDVVEREVASLEGMLATGFKLNYGQPGITCWEPTREDSIAALRDIADNLDDYKLGAEVAGAEIRQKYTLERIGETLAGIIEKTLSRPV